MQLTIKINGKIFHSSLKFKLLELLKLKDGTSRKFRAPMTTATSGNAVMRSSNARKSVIGERRILSFANSR